MINTKTERSILSGDSLPANSLAQIGTAFIDFMEADPDALLLLNEEGIIQGVNSNFERMFGYQKNYVIGKQVTAFLPEYHKEAFIAKLNRFLIKNRETHEIEGMEFIAHRSNGEEFMAEIRMGYFQVFNNSGVAISFRDINWREEKNKAILHSNKIIREQNRRLTNFSNIVSHNLKSHANNFEAILNLLANASTEEERQEMMKYLRDLSSGLTTTIGHVTEIVKIQNSKDLKIEPINLYAYVNKCIEILGIQLKATNATIHNRVKPEIILNYNTANIESILLNFLTNAIKYRHPSRDPVIWVDAKETEDGLLLQIKDNGLGINLQKHGDKLFEMYKTFHNNKDAVGVGLFITRYQVETLGGHISVESEEGVGTTFTVHFSANPHP